MSTTLHRYTHRDAASLLCLGPAGEDEQEEDEGAKEEEEEDDVGDQDGVKISSKDDEEGWEVSRLRWEKAIGTGLWASKVGGVLTAMQQNWMPVPAGGM